MEGKKTLVKRKSEESIHPVKRVKTSLSKEHEEEQKEEKNELPSEPADNVLSVDRGVHQKESWDVYRVKGCLADASHARLWEFLESFQSGDWRAGRSCYGHAIPRLIRWYGHAPIRFAGLAWPAHQYEEDLKQLQSAVTKGVSMIIPNKPFEFKSCLINKYRNGNDSIPRHSDVEYAFGPNPTIASLSVGQTRTILFRRRSRPF
ncbi:unnamed protein product [Sphagnum balticum]